MRAMPPPTLLADAREAAGLTQRQLADALGISQAHLHETEHGRRPLPVARWAAAVRALPTLTLEQLAGAAVDAGPVEVDARDASPEVRRVLVEELARVAAIARAA